LEDIDIEVKDFLVIIGPQAVGKSLCAKLLYFFRTIVEEMIYYQRVKKYDLSYDIDEEFREKFKSFFPETYWDRQNFCIEYKYEKELICKIENTKDLKLSFGQETPAYFQEEMPRLFQEFIGYNDPEKNEESLSSLSNRRIKFPYITNIFIPAGRSFFSLLQKNIFRFLRTDNNIDPFLLEFGAFYQNSKSPFLLRIPMEAQKLVRSILKGEYIYKNDTFQLDKGEKIELGLLSSGQQEALPITLAFTYIIPLSANNTKPANICVEEPEAHLFPDAQEQMSRLISFVQYSFNKKAKFVITTHSPYILAAFNNLIKAGNIVKQNPALKDAVCKKIPESMHIDVERFSAYWLENGKAVSIIDEESHLINADAIDGVSESIMETFNALLDIEYDGNEAGENV
jgi:ABC-type lipoprotein export system ATPase subunit